MDDRHLAIGELAMRTALVVKGVLDADDAWHAVQGRLRGRMGVQRGGRQLDRTIATVDALEMVASRLDGVA